MQSCACMMNVWGLTTQCLKNRFIGCVSNDIFITWYGENSFSVHKYDFGLLNWNDWGVNELCFAAKHLRLNTFTNFAVYLLINVQVQHKWSTFQKFVVCKIFFFMLKVSYAHQGLIYTLKIVILLQFKSNIFIYH